MSDNFKVPYTTILDIAPHPNADRLELATVYGFQVVVAKDKYKVGNRVIYVPIDSILPQWLEDHLFPADSKVKLNKHRVRQIRLRKYASQGMIVEADGLVEQHCNGGVGANNLVLEQDYSEQLGITKYEPPAPNYQSSTGGPKVRNRPYENPYFRKFNGITNIKWFPNVFKDQEVVIQCKLHGSHVRFGKAPFVANTLWKKIKKLFGLSPSHEFVYGSNNVELTNRKNYVGFYGEDVYGKCLAKFNVQDKIRNGEFVHGEVIGPGIQKGYTYGHTEHHLVIFDVRVMQEDGTQRWLNPEEAEAYAKERGFDFVPVLYKGFLSQEILDSCTTGKSVYYPPEIREGCVVKSRFKYDVDQSKQAFKSINPQYLDGDQSDNH